MVPFHQHAEHWQYRAGVGWGEQLRTMACGPTKKLCTTFKSVENCLKFHFPKVLLGELSRFHSGKSRGPKLQAGRQTFCKPSDRSVKDWQGDGSDDFTMGNRSSSGVVSERIALLGLSQGQDSNTQSPRQTAKQELGLEIASAAPWHNLTLMSQQTGP